MCVYSLREWLKSWGDGPNWSDPTGQSVPIAKATIEAMLNDLETVTLERDNATLRAVGKRPRGYIPASSLADELNTAREDRDAERTQKEQLERDSAIRQLEIARALGMVYEADGRNDEPAAWPLLVDGAIALLSQYRKGCELLEAERTQKEKLADKLVATESEVNVLKAQLKSIVTASMDTTALMSRLADGGMAQIAELQAERAALLEMADGWLQNASRMRAEEGNVGEIEALKECANEVLNALRAAQQPTEAAPVAKAEAPSEPAGWVPKVGDPVRVTDGELSGQLGTIIDQDTGRTWPYGVVFVGDYIRRFAAESLEHAPRSVDTSNQLAAQACPFWEEPPGLTEEELGRYYPEEPAPQPPATTGGDRPVMMGELVAIFRKLEWESVAEELESLFNRG